MDTLTPQERSARMRLVKSCDTKPELKLQQVVRDLGYRHRKSQTTVIGKPDMVFATRRRAIFIHGCFWHRHDCQSGRRIPKSRVKFWAAKFERNVQRDKYVIKQLRSGGWHALVIWECELKDCNKVGRRIRRFLDA